MKKRLIIIDLSSFIFRAFYGVRMLNAPDGTPVNSLHGILGMFLKIFTEFKPTHLIMAKDTKGGSFRNKMYPEYKANRGEPPEELIPQFPLIGELLDKMGIQSLSFDQYEADDIIGSLATQWKNEFDEILIASSDKDLMQLIDGPVKMIDTMKGKTYDRQGVFDKMGVFPEQIIDYLSMMGDSSDNIPGMRGIGAKGAAKLLAEHGTFEKCIELKDQFKGKKLQTAFSEYLDDGLLSKKLIKIVLDMKLGINFDQTKFKFYPTDDLIDFLKGLGFKSAIKKLEDIKRIEDSIANDLTNDDLQYSLGNFGEGADNKSAIIQNPEGFLNIEKKNINWLVDNLKNYTEVAIAISDNQISIATANQNIFLLDLKEDEINDAIRVICSTKNRLVGIDLKSLIKRTNLFDETIESELHDISLKQYMLTHERKNDFDTLLLKYYQKEIDQSFLSLKAHYIFSINNLIDREMKENELDHVYLSLDEPMIKILAKLESTGIICDKNYLKMLEVDYDKKILEIEKQIRTFSEHDKLNLNSPKQLSEFLFNELNLPTIKKTKTGFSTDSEVLETLKRKVDHPVPNLLLQYRELSKLLSTYVKSLPDLIAESGRIYTTFHLDGAATGRLSCSDPNLQNIPVRTPLGIVIRKAFVAPQNKILLGADYSQIELRLLAHFSNDPIMIDTFLNGGDIHLQTAAEILDKDPATISKEERGSAKAINFGLMYGQGAFGLSKQLNISRAEAKEYIENYFNRFAQIKSFLQSLKDFAHDHGFVETIYNRKRFIPQIHSHNRMEQASAERIAINSPIQGTAADLIKMAMINISNLFIKKKFKSKMILQIHDELIFEVDPGELDEVESLIKFEMENVIDLKIPLIVDINTGANWYELK